ncbi:ribosomal RNA small subunit methyltransferase D [Thiohalobacter sp. COW1]|uniref:Ribosomal RNA small subunit methyltransferase D n=1 Tax=Thiohalobacter thiocyanaticus TaxID=585455 RepID=A0A1Z4VUU1_9GAMM|nr:MULTISPECIES: 16S rRNA (guanine(966)-N(2))-methyltransferase RsmD [Thiohalobacter]BAZ95409.1 ribosomal RNA small subunit methyltransferase D [Thiohalobacter thiocyanaticus]BCO32642.1 ribosomal RNA small subunit methyltransferase D [Thiohalobacter sp. COW1]
MAGRNQLRIIGGDWRGRRLKVVDQSGLRPTPDRVRETLFNWLAPVIAGSRCLDLFAGSGALGLEAASRGAAGVTLVEKAGAAARQLRDNIALLQAGDRLELVQTDALRFLGRAPAEPYDVVFLDPPFGQGWLQRCLPGLAQPGWLAPGAYVYMEAEQDLDSAALQALLPAGWQLIRSRKSGEVGYHLARADGLQPAPQAS